ncbi:MAG: hypothetical protein AMXMBFR64_44200 [Myxococcales bacterium]
MPARYLWPTLLGAILTLSPGSSARADTQAGSRSASRAGDASRRPSQADRRLGRYGAEPLPDSAGGTTIRSYSVGTASDGYVVGGVEMALAGDSWKFIPSVAARQTNFGTPQIINAITRAAESVRERWPDALMLVGNLGRQEGGDIVQSVSHNSGRDADVAFYVTDGDAESCTLEHFALMDKAGRQINCSGTQRFDPERNWHFVRHLLTDPGAQIQWIFISTPLREILLDQARKEGADDELYRMAAAVLHQPRDSSPHADHFHIRVYCSRDDLLEGCVNTGPIWDWVETWDADVRARVAQLMETLGSPRAQDRLDAIETLNRMQARGAAPKLRELVDDEDPKVRRAALTSLTRIAPADLRPVLERLATKGDDPELQIQSIRRLAWSGSTTTVPLLIRLVKSPQRETRDAVRSSLSYLTNTHLEPGPGKGDAVERLAAKWESWYAENRTDTWAQWMRQGFEQAGLSFGGKMMRNGSIPTLIRATSRPGHIGYNAQRVLSALTGYQADPARRSGDAAQAHWTKWWKQNHKRFGFKRPSL